MAMNNFGIQKPKCSNKKWHKHFVIMRSHHLLHAKGANVTIETKVNKLPSSSFI
jgi:hypothetical protein